MNTQNKLEKLNESIILEMLDDGNIHYLVYYKIDIFYSNDYYKLIQIQNLISEDIDDLEEETDKLNTNNNVEIVRLLNLWNLADKKIKLAGDKILELGNGNFYKGCKELYKNETRFMRGRKRRA